MTATAVPEVDPQVALAFRWVESDATLSVAQAMLLDELTARYPELKRARDERFHRQHLARVAVAQAEEARRQAERAARVEARRAKWRDASAFTRACHVLAERVRPESQNGKLLLMLAELVADPESTLLSRKRYAMGKALPREERAPPVTFAPTGHEHDDPVTED